MSTDVPSLAAAPSLATNSLEAGASPARIPLPDDLEVLKRMIQELLTTLHERDRQCDQLRYRLDQLLRRVYGPRAEKFDPNQPWLFPELATLLATPASTAVPATEAAAAAAPDTAQPKTNGHGRRRLPASLPRVRQTHELSTAERACPGCGQERVKIGEQISEQLDYQPAALFVVEHVRCSYACRHCQAQATTADKPAAPIAKGLPGPGLLAHVITSKYGDYLPLYRLERIFARHGLELARQTTCDWMAACAKLLTPLYDVMVARVRQSHVLHTDDTPLPVLDKQRDRTRQGRLWVYLGDRAHPYTVFDYTPNRTRDGPAAFLADYHGYVQADAFGGYDGIFLAARGQILEVACHAHARRKFFDAKSSDTERSHAALAWYRQLYAVEHTAQARLAELAKERGQTLSAEEADALRLEMRQEQAVPLLTALCHWLKEQQAQVLPKSPMGLAIAYALNHWKALCRYTTAGFLAIDNNAAEREMKRVAIGRKNFLFVGSDQGGKTAAVLFSFTASCQRHGLDPFAYLRDVLERLAAANLQGEDLVALLPDRWASARTTNQQPAVFSR